MKIPSLKEIQNAKQEAIEKDRLTLSKFMEDIARRITSGVAVIADNRTLNIEIAYGETELIGLDKKKLQRALEKEAPHLEFKDIHERRLPFYEDTAPHLCLQVKLKAYRNGLNE